MQNILTLDIASDPIRASVLKVEGREIQVLEKLEGDLSSLFSRENMLNSHQPSLDDEQEANKENELPETEPSEGSDSKQADADTFRDFIRSIKSPWSSAVVILPPYDMTSLNLSLPFGDPKQIEKIIDMEVQDIVPFDASEFLIDHRVIDANDNGTFQVHASLIPRDFIQSLLQFFKAAQFEPSILSTPNSAISAAYVLAPELMAGNSAIVLSRDNKLHVVVAIDGQVRLDRVIEGSLSSPTLQSTNGSSPKLLNPLVDLKLTIAAVEKNFDVALQKVYFIGPQGESIPLRQSLGREVEILPASDFTKGTANSTIADMASVFARDEDPPAILTNFRTREFSYSAELKNLFAGGKQLMPYLLGILVATLVCFSSIYIVRNLRIARTHSAVREQIALAAPEVPLPEGNEVIALKGKINSLRKQLEDIGEAAAFSPLDAFIEITRIFSRFPDKRISQIEIKGNRVTIRGNAKSHKDIRDMREAFEKRKPVRCRFKKQDIQSAARGQITFIFTATCE